MCDLQPKPTLVSWQRICCDLTLQVLNQFESELSRLWWLPALEWLNSCRMLLTCTLSRILWLAVIRRCWILWAITTVIQPKPILLCSHRVLFCIDTSDQSEQHCRKKSLRQTLADDQSIWKASPIASLNGQDCWYIRSKDDGYKVRTTSKGCNGNGKAFKEIFA